MKKGPQVEEPEPDTIRAAMGGDASAFEELVRLYQADVWRFLRHQVGDGALAEDLAQETFLRAYRHLSGFAFRSKFSTWLFQIARHAAIDAHRKEARRARVVHDLAPPVNVSSPAAANEIDAALASLTPRQREALLVVEILGFPYRRAAELLEVPEGTVKRRVFDARTRLAAWMAEGEGRTGEV